MKLNARVSKLELKNRQPEPVLIVVKAGETEQQALQRCYPGEKPNKVIYLDHWDIKL
jgi:hypothetical protein